MNNTSIEILQDEAITLLKELIATPSFSKEENDTAELLCAFFARHEIPFSRVGNNIYARNKNYHSSKKSILLNSHHDTVRPNKAYSMDPFTPIEKDGKLFGLGSNDAGGCLVSLAAVFLIITIRKIQNTISFLPPVQKKKSVVSMELNWCCPISVRLISELWVNPPNWKWQLQKED